MKKTILLALVALSTIGLAQAQSPQELLRFSQTDYSLTTARSAAMAGAFTSLGADPVSMSLNPAGLGLYSRSELTLSAGLRISESNGQFGSNGTNEKGYYTKPVLSNFAYVFAHDDSGLRIGFGMNRLADFSGRSVVTGTLGTQSMAYVLRDQLQGTPTGLIGTNNYPYLKYAPVMWNSIMAYNTWLLEPRVYAGNNPAPGNIDYDVAPMLEPGDHVTSRITTVSNGAIDEFALSTAYDFNGFLFLGATLGMQNIYYKESSSYQESADRERNTGTLWGYDLNQDLSLEGFGVNLKVGVTLRPTDWLRLGVAYHSPTWITTREVSTRNMETWENLDTEIKAAYDNTADFVQEYSNQTPSRLMAGISATIARKVIVSLDYEAVWYNGMYYTTGMDWTSWRSPTSPTDIDGNPTVTDYTSRDQINVNGMIRNFYRQTNTIRVGVEAQPAAGFFLRGGFSYTDSPYSDRESVYVSGRKLSDWGSVTQFSGGLGYRRNTWGIDLAYVNSSSSSLPSAFFDHVAVNPYPGFAAGEAIMPSDRNYVDWVRHNLLFTFSWRF